MSKENPFKHVFEIGVPEPKEKKPDHLVEVISKLEQKKEEEYGLLVQLLIDIERQKIKKDLLLWHFNFSSVNWNYFLSLDVTQATKLSKLLKEFLRITETEEANKKAKEISKELENS